MRFSVHCPKHLRAKQQQGRHNQEARPRDRSVNPSPAFEPPSFHSLFYSCRSKVADFHDGEPCASLGWRLLSVGISNHRQHEDQAEDFESSFKRVHFVSIQTDVRFDHTALHSKVGFMQHDSSRSLAAISRIACATSSMSLSGVEVPAVMPTVSVSANHSGRKSDAPWT